MKPKMTVPLKQEVESETKWKLTQHYKTKTTNCLRDLLLRWKLEVLLLKKKK